MAVTLYNARMAIVGQDFDEAQKRNANRLEGRVEKFLKRCGWTAIKIDNGKYKYKIPDYLCYRDGNDTALLCECKYINSMGTTEQGSRISSLDKDFLDKNLLTNGAVTQLDFNNMGLKLTGLARETRDKASEFLELDRQNKHLYQGKSIFAVLCLDGDMAFSGFLMPTIKCLEAQLAVYVDYLALYNLRYKMPRELVYQLDRLEEDDKKRIKTIGRKTVPLSDKYGKSVHIEPYFEMIQVNKKAPPATKIF